MRSVQQIMGLPISIDIPDAPTAAPLEAAFDTLRGVDADYSPYKPDSYVSRVQSGALAIDMLPPQQLAVLQACTQWQARTNGYFDANYGGSYDPSGYVKGWAIQQAADAIEFQGFTTYCINAGGDVLLRSTNGYVWKIALQHPLQRGAIMGTIQAPNQAIATSGTYARGNHIINPLTRQPATSVLSATVIGPDIIAADVYATALCAMGFERAKQFAATLADYRVILVSPDLDAFDSAAA